MIEITLPKIYPECADCKEALNAKKSVVVPPKIDEFILVDAKVEIICEPVKEAGITTVVMNGTIEAMYKDGEMAAPVIRGITPQVVNCPVHFLRSASYNIKRSTFN